MSSTRILMAAIALALISPTVVPDAPPPATAAGSPEASIPDRLALSAGAARETPGSLNDPAPPLTVSLPGATVYAETSEQVATVERALARYAEAGLTLPQVTVHMRANGNCPRPDGTQRSGVLTIHGNGEYRIENCGTRRTLLHELGHAWEHHNVTDAQRRALLALRGLESWSHSTWHLAGGEHVAETMAWALDEGFLLPSRIPNTTVDELAAAYRLLTGTDAPVLAVTPHQDTSPDPIVNGQLILPTTDLAPGKAIG